MRELIAQGARSATAEHFFRLGAVALLSSRSPSTGTGRAGGCFTPHRAPLVKRPEVRQQDQRGGVAFVVSLDGGGTGFEISMRG